MTLVNNNCFAFLSFNNFNFDSPVKSNILHIKYRNKLKVIVKRTMRKFDYPPDMQKPAVETVLKQAEMSAAELPE